MIKVDRQKVVRPNALDLSNPVSSASVERAKAIAHVKDPVNEPIVKFAVYSRDDVKIALITLFNGKCAYCEEKINGTNARDIEHFRPKGRIDPGTGEEKLTPGYYWLAADWDNLLLSCPGCNRQQRQLERDATGNFIFANESTGKLDLFPLSVEAARVTDPHDDIADEEDFRLLLNPCIDNPEDHLTFDTEGNVTPIRFQGKQSPRAVASINTYALKRTTLNEDRKQTFLDMVKLWDTVLIASQMIDTLEPDAKDAVRAIITTNVQHIREFTHDDKPFAAASRVWIREFETELDKIKLRFQAKYGEHL